MATGIDVAAAGGPGRLYKIGLFARIVGQPVRRLRYLEELGVVLPAACSEGATRYYTDLEADRVRLVESLAELGVPIPVVARLFGPESPGARLPAEVVAAARGRLLGLAEEISARAQSLQRVAEVLRTLHGRLEACGPCPKPLDRASCPNCERPRSFGEAKRVFAALLPAAPTRDCGAAGLPATEAEPTPSATPGDRGDVRVSPPPPRSAGSPGRSSSG